MICNPIIPAQSVQGTTVYLGVFTTFNANSVTFDFSEWAQTLGAGTFSVSLLRPGDTTPYAVAGLTIDGTLATWTFDATDTALAGYGRAFLSYVTADAMDMSTDFDVYIAQNSAPSGDTPPDPLETWYQQMLEAAAQAQTAAESAEQSASAAAQRATNAMESADAARNAANSAVSAKTAIENMTAEAHTLPPGSDATVEKTTIGGVVNLDFGIPRGDTGAKGEKGDRGEQGIQGERGLPGVDGYSPTVAITDIDGGHRVTITDETGAHSFDVLDGEDAPNAVTDVQLNGVSVVSGGVAEIPLAAIEGPAGVVALDGLAYGLSIVGGRLRLYAATSNDIKTASTVLRPITAARQHEAVFYGLAEAAGSSEASSALPVGQYTVAAKSAIHEMLNAAVSIEGTTPTINALPGVRYVCGEVDTLDITLPSSGIVDVTFECGSTPTVLTVTPPTGVTVKWTGGFDPSALDANTTYELNIMDGLGVAAKWT